MAASEIATIAAIVAELKKGGPLRDLRPPSDDERTGRTPLESFAADEVQRSIDRIRMLRTFKPPVAMPTISDYHNIATALRKVAFTDEQRAAFRQLEAVRQTPPAHANALKYHCAKEAFDLMGFSAKAPTGMPGGPFRTIADRLYAAVTGEPPYSDATMRRACGLVLDDQRKNNFHAFEREPLT